MDACGFNKVTEPTYIKETWKRGQAGCVHAGKILEKGRVSMQALAHEFLVANEFASSSPASLVGSRSVVTVT